MAIKIVLFEDNERLRESLAYLLKMNGYNVVGDYSQCSEAANIARVYEPDVVLMDIDMPGENGIKGVRMIKEARPKTSVVMYTVFEDDEKLFECLCAGANGYLLKKTPPARLFDAIQEVLEGGAPMSPVIARKVLNTFQVKETSNKYNLSPREIEVLQWLIKGYSIKIIAAEMNLAFDTVRSHLKNIYQKLHVNCGKEAIAKALSERIV
ncbi:two-component system response regulator [Niastella yeongjuensis]|uniref:Two-component system response regulator n=1 Tax=Niastella yeongjuensis TaxID=354355 RepID=A0A1V9EZ76_9BACT|nr:response regulator transcription factor [Niastella yeongjuensis]OQP51339.1 two-component system response regulator [Niastella yeongjuensis]SEP38689.1 DNA-binding response regulator, NarL/FixJ family, contains REC and HTH domains [Niastella yeongjuensis]